MHTPLTKTIICCVTLAVLTTACTPFWSNQTTNQSRSNDKDGLVNDAVQPGEVAIIDSNIIVLQPVSNTAITSPLAVSGRAKVNSNQVVIRLKDNFGTVVATSTAPINPAENEWGGFSGSLSFTRQQTALGVLEVFSLNPQTSQEENLISVPITFKNFTKPRVKVFFNNTEGDPGLAQCDKVYPIERETDGSVPLLIVALGELLTGPSAKDISDGFISQIPKEGVKIQQLNVDKNVLNIDFNSAIQQGVTTTCAFIAIRAQITQTAKQFSGFKDVVITINGKADGVLPTP